MPFIVLEGLDGSGKSTQIGFLRDYLSSRGIEPKYLHFPRFDTPVYGDMIARFLRGEMGTADKVDPYLVAMLFAGDRADAAAKIDGWLEEGEWVLLDRYVYSNFGYQCAKLAGDKEREELRRWILDLEFGHYRIPRPDVSVFLDVPFSFTTKKLTDVRQGDDRDYLKGAEDIHEASLSLQRNVREVYLWAAEKDPKLRVVDCSDGDGQMGTPVATFGKIMNVLCEYINLDYENR